MKATELKERLDVSRYVIDVYDEMWKSISPKDQLSKQRLKEMIDERVDEIRFDAVMTFLANPLI